jgi:hypothetical protein
MPIKSKIDKLKFWLRLKYFEIINNENKHESFKFTLTLELKIARHLVAGHEWEAIGNV